MGKCMRGAREYDGMRYKRTAADAMFRSSHEAARATQAARDASMKGLSRSRVRPKPRNARGKRKIPLAPRTWDRRVVSHAMAARDIYRQALLPTCQVGIKKLTREEFRDGKLPPKSTIRTLLRGMQKDTEGKGRERRTVAVQGCGVTPEAFYSILKDRE
jgi:hypothetical protein